MFVGIKFKKFFIFQIKTIFYHAKHLIKKSIHYSIILACQSIIVWVDDTSA